MINFATIIVKITDADWMLWLQDYWCWLDVMVTMLLMLTECYGYKITDVDWMLWL
jgi:hypothetical protein